MYTVFCFDVFCFLNVVVLRRHVLVLKKEVWPDPPRLLDAAKIWIYSAYFELVPT